MGSGKAKSNVGALLILLTLVGGYGVWNWQRHDAAEEKQVRPYKSYSDAQLDELKVAYEGETGMLSARYEVAQQSRSGSRDVGFVGEAIDQFERVQRAATRKRDLGAQLSQEQASLNQIVEEQAYRARAGSGAVAFLRRAFLPPVE